MGHSAPDGGKAGIKSPSDIRYWMITYEPSLSRIDAEFFERALKDATVGFSEPLSLRNKNYVHQVTEAEVANLVFLHTCRPIRDNPQLGALRVERGQH